MQAKMERNRIKTILLKGKGNRSMLNILYEDEAVLVVWKPVGLESQSGRGFDADMVSENQWIITSCPQNLWNLMWELSTDWISR